MCLGSRLQGGTVVVTGRARGRGVGQLVLLPLQVRSRQSWLLAGAQLTLFPEFGLAL